MTSEVNKHKSALDVQFDVADVRKRAEAIAYKHSFSPASTRRDEEQSFLVLCIILGVTLVALSAALAMQLLAAAG